MTGEACDVGAARSVVEPILARVRQRPESTAVVLMADDGSEKRLSISELHGLAVRYSQALLAHEVERDDLIVFAARFSRDLVAALLGTLYVGATSSIYPHLGPLLDPDRFRAQLHHLALTARVRAIIVNAGAMPTLRQEMAGAGCLVLEVEDLPARDGDTETWHERLGRDEQIAYIQFTSGTTGMQKGVELSHRAILSQLRALDQVLHITADDVVVNWMPLYHDAGLFLGLVMPLVVGIPTVLMSPFTFLRHPDLFFRALHRHRGSLAVTTNAALRHALRLVRDHSLVGLDLGSIRSLIGGAEPVLHATVEAFHARLSPYGFRRNAFSVGHGMAESTLLTTLTAVGVPARVDWIDGDVFHDQHRALPVTEDAPRAKPIYSCGHPLPGLEIRVVDDEHRLLPERRVGNILLRGGFLFSGYHRRSDLTTDVFRDGWFCTGDTGYFSNGQLFVCGRKKDLIIVNGQDVYPHDIEAVANNVPQLSPQGAVAFGVLDEALGTERIVLVCDLHHSARRCDRLDLERELRQRIHRELGLSIGEVHLMRRRWVVRTPNGKIARGANREKYVRTVANVGGQP